MQAVTLDILEKAQFTATQARAVAQGIETEVIAHQNELATKGDLLRIELKMEQLRNDLIKWMFGTAVSQALVVLGGVWFVVQHARP
jgi:hypothetical protein